MYLLPILDFDVLVDITLVLIRDFSMFCGLPSVRRHNLVPWDCKVGSRLILVSIQGALCVLVFRYFEES